MKAKQKRKEEIERKAAATGGGGEGPLRVSCINDSHIAIHYLWKHVVLVLPYSEKFQGPSFSRMMHMTI